MEPKVSFIPKKVLTAEPAPMHRVAVPNLFLVIAVVILILCLIFYGGAILYRFLLDRQINQPCAEAPAGGVVSCGLLASVEREEKNLNRDTILLLQRLDKKIKIAAALGDSHIDALPILRLLEALTLPTIAYDKFTFQEAKVKLAGTATKYEDLAVQSDVFAGDKRVRHFVFSGLNLNELGQVVFELELELDPAVFTYINRLGS